MPSPFAIFFFELVVRLRCCRATFVCPLFAYRYIATASTATLAPLDGFFSATMVSPRMTSPPDIRVYDFNDSNHDRPRLSARSSLSASIPLSRTAGPMPIRNAREEVPPPLPPPPHLDEIDLVNDLGGQWANTFGGGFGKTGLPMINPSSSLCVGQDRRLHEIGDGLDFTRRRTSAATARLSPDIDPRWEGFRHKDEGYHSLSGSGIANQSVVPFYLRSSPVQLAVLGTW